MTFPLHLRPRTERPAPEAEADFHPGDCPHRRRAEPIEALRPCCGGDPLCRAMARLFEADAD